MESPTSNSNIKELRSNLSREEINRIRKKLYKKEAASYFFKEKEQEGSLTNRQKNVLKNIDRYLTSISKHLKDLKKCFKKSQKYQYGIDYLFNEHNDINAFQEAKTLLDEHRSNLLHKETNENRKKLYEKEAVYNFLKEKEQNSSLANIEKKVLKKIDKYLKNFKKDLDKLQKYQYNTTHGFDYLFNEHDEEDITNQQKSRVLLMVVMYYMKVKEIKMLDYQ